MVVLTTRSLDDPPPTGLEARAGDISEIAAELEAQGYCRIWIEGGGRVVQSQVAIGKLDVHELAMISVILGKGILLFQYAGGELKLRLVKGEANTKGAVHLVYEGMA